MLLYFRLIGLGTVPLLQSPYIQSSHSDNSHNTSSSHSLNAMDGTHMEPSRMVTVDDLFPSNMPGTASTKANQQLKTSDLPNSVRLSVLLEAIRTGRIFLLNSVQCMAFMTVAFLSLGYVCYYFFFFVQVSY